MGRREEEEEEEEAARPDLTAEEEQSLSPATGRDEPGGQATLVVKVLEGKELMAADRSGTSDPYAIVEYGRAKKQTRTVKKDLNPEWNETFYLDFNAKAEKVSIEVYDYDLIGSHDFLGRVEISMSEMKMEAVVQDWFDLKPRPSKNEIVSGSLHLYLAIIPKDREADLNLGLDAHSWLDLDSFRAKGHERKYHTIRMYFASTFADFQVEFESLYTSVFPKLSTLCQLHGYEFIPVVMRYGMDERMDKMYALDPRVARLCFHEIAECRRISPRANFCALIGDRYGSSPLPPSLDKNEYMAILSHVEEQKEEELYQLLERWYKLDENQSPNRVLLQSADGKISPSAGPGTSEHKEWESIERKLFEGLYKSSKQVLASFRVEKYEISLFEQELSLGILLPEDSAEHTLCVIRSVSNMRIVNTNAAKYIDVAKRRGDSIVNELKEIRPEMVDESRRNQMIRLKERIARKIGNRCLPLVGQWQGWTIGSEHIQELCESVYEGLRPVLVQEMRRYPRYSLRREEVWEHKQQLKLCLDEMERREGKVMERTLDSLLRYLRRKSDGNLAPCLLYGCEGSGMSSMLANVAKWAKEELSIGLVQVYRDVGRTPDSLNGLKLLHSLMEEMKLAYQASSDSSLNVSLHVLEGKDLPAADRGGTSDPYLEVKIGDKTVTTQIQMKTLNPVWDQKFYWENVRLTDVIQVSVWDYDRFSKNDMIGTCEISLSSFELNIVKDRWYSVDMNKQEEKKRQYEYDINVKVIEAQNIIPRANRMDVDPYIKLTLGDLEGNTEHKNDSQDPVFDEEFSFKVSAEEDLTIELWDKGLQDSQDVLMGSVVVHTTEVATDAPYEDWLEFLDRNARAIGKLHVVINKKQEEMEEEEEDVDSGPRVRFVVTVSSNTDNLEAMLDGGPVEVPCTYLEMCEAFKQTISKATASKPLLLMLDGLDRLSEKDSVTSMRWMPPVLPRYVHAVFTLNKTAVDNHAPVYKVLKDAEAEVIEMELFNAEHVRTSLSKLLTKQSPVRTLTNSQRNALLNAVALKSSPVRMQQLGKLASMLPSYAEAVILKGEDSIFFQLIQSSKEFVCNGRVDEFRLWRLLDLLSRLPFGFSETEIKKMLGGGIHGLLPGLCYAETMLALSPVLAERQADGRLVYALGMKTFAKFVIQHRGEVSVSKDLLLFFRGLPRITDGRQPDSRRLRVLAALTRRFETAEEWEHFLTDLQLVELRLASGHWFDLAKELNQHGPGRDGGAADILAFLEENAQTLQEEPLSMLQMALNMPDHTRIYEKAMKLERQRRKKFFADEAWRKLKHLELLERKDKTFSFAELQSLSSIPLELAWDSPKPSMRWVNKPQTRGLCKRTLHGHLAGTFGAVWARGGRGVISCSEDRTLKAWSAITGEFLRDLGEHEKAIHVLASSPWGETFASGSEDGVVKVWSVKGDSNEEEEEEESSFPQEILRVQAASRRITGIAFVSPTSLAISSEEPEVKIIEISSASEIATVVPFRLGVSSIDVAFYNNSMLLATAGGDAVKLWRLPTLDKRGGLYGHKKRVSAVRFCPSAPVAATGSWDSSVMVWAQSSPLVWLNVQVLSGHSDMVRSLAWSPQGSTLVSASSDKTVKIWKGSEAPEVSEWRLAATIDGHTDAVTDVKFHPQGQTVLTCSRDSKVKLFDTNVPFETSPVVSHSLPVLLAAVCGKKQVAVTVSEDQEVKVWEYTTGTFLVSQSSSHSSGISAIALSSDGRFVLTGGRDGAIRRREIQGLAPAGVQQEVKRAHQGGVAVLEHHREESFLLSAGRSDGRIVVWESEALLDLAVLVVGEGSVIYRALFSSDSKFVISADDKRGMRLWNIETGREVFAQTLGSSEKLAKVDFSSDGRFIATVKTSSEQIEVWDASGGGLKGSLKKHQGKVVDTSFSTDGKFLSSIATDKNLIVWRLSSLRPLCSFSLAQSPCCLCAYQAWPCLVVGDQIGSVFFLTFVEPQPPEESDEED